MPKDTTKASQVRTETTHLTLKKSIEERDAKLKEYQEKLDSYIKENSVEQNKSELKKFNQDIKKLERKIQKNINDHYPTKAKKYDEMFEDLGGKPKSYILGTKFQYAKNSDELQQMKDEKEFKFPKITTTQETDPQPSGEEEVKDSKSGFGRKGGKAEALEETTASMRGAKGKGKAKEEIDIDARGQTTEEQKDDLEKSKGMTEFEITRLKNLISYMEQFKPLEHAEMIANRDQFIASHPEYMELNQDVQDRLTLYYTEKAFNKFDLQDRQDIIKDLDPPNLRGGKEQPQEEKKQDEDIKLKSSDSNNKANAQPGEANSGAETNAQNQQDQPPTEQTTATTTETPVESTDPTTETKFEGREGEVETTLGVGSVGGFKNDILSQLEPQSEIASKLAEDKIRKRKDIDRLIKEIECFHLVYDNLIPMFRDKEHNKAKDDAIQSKDRDKLIKHHQMMSDAIRKYYKTADLRVGVVMSAESMFGQSVSNLITNHMQSGGVALPNALGGAKFIPKGSDPVKSAVAGNVNIRRGGINTRRVPKRLVPKIALSQDAQKIPEFTPVVDAPMPYVFQTGIRNRRQYRDPNLRLKSKK